MARDLLRQPITYWEMVDWLDRHAKSKNATDHDPEILAQIRLCIDAYHALFYRPANSTERKS